MSRRWARAGRRGFVRRDVCADFRRDGIGKNLPRLEHHSARLIAMTGIYQGPRSGEKSTLDPSTAYVVQVSFFHAVVRAA